MDCWVQSMVITLQKFGNFFVVTIDAKRLWTARIVINGGFSIYDLLKVFVSVPSSSRVTNKAEYRA